MKSLGLGAAILAAAMGAVNLEAPAIGGRPTPVFVNPAEYDGLGRKKKAKRHPRHMAKRRRSASDFAEFKRRVEATHSDREDPRPDYYLHSNARQLRALKRQLAA